jgi:hypothetical protein
VLACAFVGFACLGIITQTFTLITGAPLDHPSWLLVLLVAAGMSVHTLAHGTLAHIGLHGGDGCATHSLRAAVRAALSRWRPLLLASLTHTVLTFICVLGITPLLLGSGLGMDNRGPSYPNPDSIPRLVVVRSLDIVMLGPFHPLHEQLQTARDTLRQLAARPGSAPLVMADFLQLEYRLYMLQLTGALQPSTPPPDTSLVSGVVALLSLTLLATTETLLCFRAAAAMSVDHSPNPNKRSIAGPLIDSARLAWGRFRLVAVNTWMLRLMVSAIHISCIILPVAIADNIVLPQVVWTAGEPWLSLTSRLACCAGSAAVDAILIAFCALYMTRLFAKLST